MSYSNSIKSLLDIQDQNISFEEDFTKEGAYKGKRCTYISGKLTYTPTHCEKCGIKNTHFTVYKNGTQVSRITLPITGVCPTYLFLQKQRFICRACQCSFVAQTTIVQTACFISQNVKAQIVVKSAEAHSLTSIAKDCFVCLQLFNVKSISLGKQFNHSRNTLPMHLSFDEFKYVKGAMAFEYINVVTGDILNILERRDKATITDHFIVNYRLQEQKCVETVTIDMNAGYECD